MRFVAKQPREGINVSDVHPLAEAGMLIAGLSAIFAVIALALVFFVDLALLYISADTEQRIFSSWSPDGLISVEPDDVRTEKTRQLLDRLVRYWPESPYAFRLELTKSSIPNAMAIPGGLIVITTGLLDRVESENELAFVIGHELGHFRNRDHMRQLGRGAVFGLLLTALGASEGGATLSFTITDLALRGFSREQESNADGFGLYIVNSEYGHVNESWRFFDRIGEESRSLSELLVYASTHPAPGERIENLKFLARANGWSLKGGLTPLEW
jgi:Zn-dependent protease with chaperone function